jgi:hypothetical protein
MARLGTALPPLQTGNGWMAGPGYLAELADCETQNSLPSGSVSVIQVWEPC